MRHLILIGLLGVCGLAGCDRQDARPEIQPVNQSAEPAQIEVKRDPR